MGFRNPLTALSQLVADAVIGAVLKTAATGNRIEIYNEAGGLGRMDFYTGYGETEPGRIVSSGAIGGGQYGLYIASPQGVNDRATLLLESYDAPSLKSRVVLVASELHLGDVDAGSTVLFGERGTPFAALDYGYFTGNTNASGDVSVPHALVNAPAMVLAHASHAGQPWIPWVQQGSITGSQIPFRMRRADTNAVAPAGTAVAFNWLAFRS